MSSGLAKDTIAQFVSRIENASDYHRELLLAVHLKRHQGALETMLSEQFVFNIVVLWEVFLNDVLVSYLVMSPRRYLRGLRERILQSTDAKFGAAALEFLEFEFPSSLSRQKASSLADPRDFNIAVDSAATLTNRANNLLAAKYARLFTLGPEDAQLIDYIVAIRNYLAHRSRSSRTGLNNAVTTLSGKNAPLRGNVSNVGTYLKSRNAAGDTRSLIISARLVEIANLLK